MTTGTPSRRRSPAPPAEGHRPLRATGYRVPVVLDSEFDDESDSAGTWATEASTHAPMWEEWSVPEPEPEPDPAPFLPPVAPAATYAAAPVPVLHEHDTYADQAPAAPFPHRYDRPVVAPDEQSEEDVAPRPPRSLYLAALRVRHLRPGVFQRVLLVEGVFALAIVVVLADLASPWLIAVLPVVSAVLVKLHDLVEEGLARARTQNSPGGSPGLRQSVEPYGS